MLRRFWLVVFLWGGCSDDPEETEPECIDVSTDCNPLYPPTFEEVFRRTLNPTCSSDLGSCHGTNEREGGLMFQSEDESYALLLGLDGGRPRVKPFDAPCSKLVVRTHSVGKPWQMPPGQALSAAERCAIAEWVRSGAERN